MVPHFPAQPALGSSVHKRLPAFFSELPQAAPVDGMTEPVTPKGPASSRPSAWSQARPALCLMKSSVLNIVPLQHPGHGAEGSANETLIKTNNEHKQHSGDICHNSQIKFKMLTNASLLRLGRQSDWFTSIDLKDTYFHIPISYRAATAPRHPPGHIPIQLAAAGAVAAGSRDTHTHTHTLQHLQSVAFVINQEKCMLSPAQEVSFLGLSLNSVTFRARLSEDSGSPGWA